MRRLYKTGLAALALAFIAASCGEATTATEQVEKVQPGSEVAGADGEDSNVSAEAQPKGFSTKVTDLATGEIVTISDVVTGDRPVLVWSYASYCSACRAEAPGIDDFAEKHKDKVQVIGVGITGTAESAQEFKASTQVDSSILWSPDSSIVGSTSLDLGGYPRHRLYSQDLTQASKAKSGFSEKDVLATIEKLSA